MWWQQTRLFAQQSYEKQAASVLWLTILFFLSVHLSAQQQQSWTWRDGTGNVRSRADLEAVRTQHKLWLDTNGKSGARANLSYADLRRADLSGMDLNGADLSGADLSGADLTAANLARADLRTANMGDTNLSSTEMGGAFLSQADLSGARFEPKNFPELHELARAHGLHLMTYQITPNPLTQIRKQFQDAGFHEQERAITCALNRANANFDSPSERWFKRVAFDFTSQYGLAPWQPLRLVLWLWSFFSGVYAFFMHRPGASGIYFVGTRWWRGRSNTQGIQIRPRTIRAKGWRFPFLWLLQESRVFRVAMFFSLISAFNIGFRDINFGRWLRMLTKREYDLKAFGWARTASGLQSLLSVYLIALWVLVYFGRPFG
jgi:hypothetical protein